MTLRITNAQIHHKGALKKQEIQVEDGTITRIAETVEGDNTLDLDSNFVLPGAVDVHVHFREPGATQKEDWGSGSRSAAAGGITTVVDQPNTEPPTITGEAFDKKHKLAKQKSIVDYGINAGVTPNWEPDELTQREVTAYGEVFMADSTGGMGVTKEFFHEAVQRLQKEDHLITVHAEDASFFQDIEGNDPDAWSRYRPPEAEINAVKYAIETATKPLHFAHISHPESVDLISGTSHTCEATPHHLLLSRNDLQDLDTHGKMNPPLRSEEARQRLWKQLLDGDIDIVATDHAPHTKKEKQEGVWSTPSGVPGVETMLPLLLNRVVEEEVSLDRVVELVSRAPARIFGFERKGRIEEGMDADLVVTDMQPSRISGNELHSRAGWTPFEGWRGVFPTKVMRRGRIILNDGFTRNTGELLGREK